MTELMINLLLMTCIIVFIIDLSGVIDEMEKGLAKWLKVKTVHIPKPFSCSLCMTWWSGLLYLILAQALTWKMVGYLALLSFFTPVIYNALRFFRDLFDKFIDCLYKLLYR